MKSLVALAPKYLSALAVLPWGSCDNWWNTETCVSAYSRQNLTSYVEGNTTFYNLNGTIYAAANLTDPVKEYWEYVHLRDPIEP